MYIICTYAINADGLCRQAKKGRQNQVRQAGKGILTLVDHLSVKQSQAVRKKAGVTEEEWSTKWEEIVAKHDLPGIWNLGRCYIAPVTAI